MQVGAPDGWPWGTARTATNARRTLRAKERGCISFVMVLEKERTRNEWHEELHFISSESVQGCSSTQLLRIEDDSNLYCKLNINTASCLQ